MNHEDYCDALASEVDRFADGYATADRTSQVPSCPDWSVEELARHLGSVHRWATLLVARRAPARIPRVLADDVIDEVWIREGGAELVEVLRAADPDESMWAWGADQHVRFWSRRQLHETFVHRLDLELATRAPSPIEPGIAFDAIDEFLANMASDADISLRARDGRSEEFLRFHSNDPEGQWSVRLGEGGYEFLDSYVDPDVELSGASSDLVSVVLRRCDLSAVPVVVRGDRSLLEHWLSRTAFL
ncbi:MAG TPA: maleylpyruvate isomerase family mycothiol-dependent enzyme [Acidimicrobiales bacterium]|nr:maleylpyruvate isomerase family mycothiol-dependent enzyme [Acidimicrobiales bacterium]